MFEVKAIIRPQRLHEVRMALREIDALPGITVSTVHAFARVHPHDGDPATEAIGTDFLKVETVVPEALADRVVDTIQRAATTGQSGDGMVFKIPVADAVRIRSGEHGATAL